MGLFGSRKWSQKIIETSKNTNNNLLTSDDKKQISSQQEFDELNENAEVKTRSIGTSTDNKIEQTTDVLSETEVVSESTVIKDTQENDSTFKQNTKEGYLTFKNKPSVDHVIGQTQILAIINQKGGVGKSTTAVNLASSLGYAGKEVLLVDLDPQGNTTSGFGINKRDLNTCVYDVLLGVSSVEDVILTGVGKHVDVLPATINLAGAEVELVNEMARENRLKMALGSLRGRYDYVLIDCPPSLGLLTINALVASDKLLVPIQCEFYALEGVTKLLDSMKRVKSMLNPSLDIFGIVLTMYDSRTNLSKQVVEEVKSFFGNLVFNTIIPRTVKLSEAPSYGQPINEYAPDNKGAIAYDNLAKEVISRG